MPRKPGPVRPRRKDERDYERELRAMLNDVLFLPAEQRLAAVEAVRQAYDVLDEIVEPLDADPADWLDVAVIQRNLDTLKGYHKARLIQTFRSALGVDIRPVLTEPQIRTFMAQKVADNVDLIKTIPRRFHASLRERLEQELVDAPFDKQRLTQLLQKEFKSSGYNLRRIARDQTSKTIGGLTEIRHRQLGIEGYEWVTSQDERVRPTHVANSGQMFSWASPPIDTGHPGQDIQCRCVAVPVILQRDRERLQAVAGPTSILS